VPAAFLSEKKEYRWEKRTSFPMLPGLGLHQKRTEVEKKSGDQPSL
jgi:hypothetical protein